MDDEPIRPRKQYPVSPAKMSKTPSWVMLGFVLGALTVAALPPLRKEKSVSANSVPTITATRAKRVEDEKPRPRPQLSTIEAVFEQWAQGAVWDADSTEVALWNAEAGDFTEFYEVLRYAGRYYYRSIPTLTRRVIQRGKPIPNCPLLFTETEEQYQEWRQHGRSERPFGDFRPVTGFQQPKQEEPRPSGGPGIERVEPPKLETVVPFQPPRLYNEDVKK